MNRSGKTAMSLHPLLQAIADAPGDVSRRLVYADWLEERGSSLCHEWRKPLVRTRLAEDTEHGGSVYANGDGAGDGSLPRTGRDNRGNGLGDGFVRGYGHLNGDGEGPGYSLDPWIPLNDGYGNGDHNMDVADGRGDGQGEGLVAGRTKALIMTGAAFL